MSFVSGVSTCRRPRAPLVLATFAVTAVVAGLGLQATTVAPRASADERGTSDGHLASQRSGAENPEGLLPSDCSAAVADGADVLGVVPAAVRIGTLKVADPECNSAMSVTDASPATGRTQDVNPGTAGQCTWGAAQKWFEASGAYPALVGDAMSWNEAATAAGWTVTDDARDRSIVVFEPGVAGAGSVGHVAWVNSVSETSEGRWIHVTEMNNSYLGGVGIFNDRDVKDIPGMSYILLP